jgi:aryl-alcohol dehydrogenase-like predicted oxidoreductase
MIQRFDERHHLASVQSNYNLLDRHVEQDILPYCRARGIAFIARGPLAMGKLSGKLTKDHKFDANDIRRKWLEGDNHKNFQRDIDTVERLKPIAQQCGVIMAELAVKFVLTHVAVSTTIPGTKNRNQLEHNVAASILPPLTGDELAAIRETLATA